MAESLLITGPPASGKSRLALERLRSILDSILITPATLAAFVDARASAQAAPEPVLHLLVRRALAKLRIPRFEAVAEFRGFHRALVAGMDQEEPEPDFARVRQEVERGLAERGMALRNRRLRSIAAVPEHLVFDGFFSFSPAELDLICAMPLVTVVSRDALPRLRMAEVRLTEAQRNPRRLAFTAPTMEREAEEIARRILDSGRKFREIGIVLREREPYAPLLETTLARFGIPARLGFRTPLASHPAIRSVSGVVRLILSGWNHELLLPLVADDKLDFELREKLPGIGLPLPALNHLEELDSWRRDVVEPGEWGARLDALAGGAAGRLRSGFYDEGPVTLEEFWKWAELTLALEPLEVRDLRRDVVEVIDVADSWAFEKPLVFVCGLAGNDFPLFDVAASRATEQVVLSYAQFNEKGDTNLASSFLKGVETVACEGRIRPPSLRERASPPVSAIQDPALLTQLQQKHVTLSATSIDNFLQCPFQFFTRRTLKLRERPLAPRDRLDLLTQGSIVHDALASKDFNPVFAETAGRKRIPVSYRTEAVRLEMLRHFEAFLADNRVRLGWESSPEVKFDFALNPALRIRGRIDRLDRGPGNRALVIDYKYSAGQRVRALKESPVQGGLYLLAAEREFGMDPAGMLYVGIKKGVSWEGWHTAIPGLQEVGESVTPAYLRELMEDAAAKAMESLEKILAGSVAPNPADEDKCKWCEVRDVCRIEEKPARVSAAASQGAQRS